MINSGDMLVIETAARIALADSDIFDALAELLDIEDSRMQNISDYLYNRTQDVDNIVVAVATGAALDDF